MMDATITRQKRFFSQVPVAYMEDDVLAKEKTTQGLIELGFKVKQIEGDKDALIYAKEHNNQQHIMYVLDINMGSGNATLGIRISRKIKALYPKSLVVLLSSKLGEVSADEVRTSKADVVLKKKDSINDDVMAIAEEALSAFTKKINLKRYNLMDHYTYEKDHKPQETTAVNNTTFSMASDIDKFLSDIKHRYHEYFDIKCTSEAPHDNFFNHIKDKHISNEFVTQNIATELVHLNISSDQSHDFDLLEQLLLDFSSVEIPIPTLDPLSDYEKKILSIMTLYPKTGSLNSFGDSIDFRDAGLLVTPNLLDLIDMNCTTSILEDNSLITVDIKCTIFGVYS